MPNRILQGSLLTSASLDKLSGDEERLFHRLVLVSDDWGRFEARSAAVRGNCFPTHEEGISLASIDSWLAALIDQEIIYTYSASGRIYGHFLNWWRYQRWRGNKSKHPEPPDGDNRENPQRRETDEVAANLEEVAAKPQEIAAKTVVTPLAHGRDADAATGGVAGVEVVAEVEDEAGAAAAAGAGARAREGPAAAAAAASPDNEEFLQTLETTFRDEIGPVPRVIEEEMRDIATRFPALDHETALRAVREAVKFGAEHPWPYIARVLERVASGKERSLPSRNGHREPTREEWGGGPEAVAKRKAEWDENREWHKRRESELAAAREPPEEPS